MKTESRSTEGFTLTELTVVIAVVAILTAVALPLYQNYLVKSRRAEAYIALESINVAEASFFAGHEYYSVSLLELGLSLGASPNAANLWCREGSAVMCGKTYAAYVQWATSQGFYAIAEGEPVAGKGLDTFVLSQP